MIRVNGNVREFVKKITLNAANPSEEINLGVANDGNVWEITSINISNVRVNNQTNGLWWQNYHKLAFNALGSLVAPETNEELTSTLATFFFRVETAIISNGTELSKYNYSLVLQDRYMRSPCYVAGGGIIHLFSDQNYGIYSVDQTVVINYKEVKQTAANLDWIARTLN